MSAASLRFLLEEFCSQLTASPGPDGELAELLRFLRSDRVRANPAILTRYLSRFYRFTNALRSNSSSLANRVRQVIGQLLEQDQVVTVEKTAAWLNMSRSTLYKHLKQEGQTFADILTGVRQDEAKWLLEQSGLPLSAIAEKLGFSDQSAFSRAFKRWEGLSPAAYRSRETLV